MTEPQCQHCGKTLSEALREGCNESPCKEYREKYNGPLWDEGWLRTTQIEINKHLSGEKI